MMTFKQFLESQYRQSGSDTFPVTVNKYSKQILSIKPTNSYLINNFLCFVQFDFSKKI